MQNPPITETEMLVTDDGLGIYVPLVGDRVWGSEIPSTPYMNEALELRGEDLGNGFRVPQHWLEEHRWNAWQPEG